MPKSIEERHFATAAAFLKALSPFDDFWFAHDGARTWRYRGHRDDAWKLVPSSMRPGALAREVSRIVGVVSSAPDSLKNTSAQVQAEHRVLARFINGALNAGLPVPEDSQLLRNEDLVLRLIGGSKRHEASLQGVKVPMTLYQSLYALAQHHGVPTRLLDWSESSFVAAYFACVDVAKSLSLHERVPEGTTGRNLAVFALREAALNQVKYEKPDGFQPSLTQVTAPYEWNPNLKAQKGLFTLLYYDTPREKDEWRLPALEDALKGWCVHKHGHEDSESVFFPYLVKLTLPREESRRLLRLLVDVQICAPTIFPSYDAVRMGMEEESYWQP